uniref:Uncharacterized protein n=1 Tax=Arundo donax TaxID=35708 RepID=A0A0A8YG70_ARUDO
MKSMEPST